MPMKKDELKRACDQFFKKMDRVGLALTYGDVRLQTDYSEILPGDAQLMTMFSRNIKLKIPIVSAPMDTVTERKMATTLAMLGGLGIIHKAMSPKEQASIVSKVKHELNGFISDPICVSTDDTVEKILNLIRVKEYKFFSFMVKDENGKIVGLITRNDFDFCPDTSVKISEIMSTEIIRAESGTTDKEAYDLMIKIKKKILPVFKKGEFQGIYTLSDVKRSVNGNVHDYNLDSKGRLVVGAAIGVGADLEERMELVANSNVDAVVFDSAHGNSRGILERFAYCKRSYPNIDFIVGNISEAGAAKRLVDAGADGLRVGQGPGSICTTRVVAGVGTPQVSAIYNCERAIRGSGVPIIGDGGIKDSGDIPIAIVAGASCVMLGNLLAGTKESPGEIIQYGGNQVKIYRGMGSVEAMEDNKSNRERYGLGDVSRRDKLVAEGVSSFKIYKGEVAPIIYQLLGGLRSGMGYLGSKTIDELRMNGKLFQITNAGLKESNPHDLDYINGQPNYQQNK